MQGGHEKNINKGSNVQNTAVFRLPYPLWDGRTLTRLRTTRMPVKPTMAQQNNHACWTDSHACENWFQSLQNCFSLHNPKLMASTANFMSASAHSSRFAIAPHRNCHQSTNPTTHEKHEKQHLAPLSLFIKKNSLKTLKLVGAIQVWSQLSHNG